MLVRNQAYLRDVGVVMSGFACECRVVEPLLFQVEDDLICRNCGTRKALPPRIDFCWESEKRELVPVLQNAYADYSKEGLIALLIQQNMRVLDAWKYGRKHKYIPAMSNILDIIQDSLKEVLEFQNV